MVRLYHASELRYRDALLVGLYYVFKLLCHDLHLVCFHASFKYQIKQQFFSSTNQEGNKKCSLNYKPAELAFKNGYMHRQYL